MLLLKNPKILSNQADIKELLLPTHGLIIFTKSHDDWIKIVEFLMISYFWDSKLFYLTVFTLPLKVFTPQALYGVKLNVDDVGRCLWHYIAHQFTTIFNKMELLEKLSN